MFTYDKDNTNLLTYLIQVIFSNHNNFKYNQIIHNMY